MKKIPSGFSKKKEETGVDETIKKIIKDAKKLSQVIVQRNDRPHKAALAERRETAACFEEPAQEETFAWYLLHDFSKETTEAAKRPEHIAPSCTRLKEYTEGLLQIECELYTYCDRRDIVKQVKNGQFLLASMERVFEKNVLFGKSKLSLDVQTMYEVICQRIEAQKQKTEVDKEQVLLILYNGLLLAQNAFMPENKGEAIQFSSIALDIPFVFERMEQRLCPKSTLKKQYQAAKEQLDEKQREATKKWNDEIVLYHSVTYVRMAGTLVYEYAKQVGML